jgi:hypothetical protein
VLFLKGVVPCVSCRFNLLARPYLICDDLTSARTSTLRKCLPVQSYQKSGAATWLHSYLQFLFSFCSTIRKSEFCDVNYYSKIYVDVHHSSQFGRVLIQYNWRALKFQYLCMFLILNYCWDLEIGAVEFNWWPCMTVKEILNIILILSPRFGIRINFYLDREPKIDRRTNRRLW